jgi:pimeloyl-ACP methyl ester carboxylesterase
MVPTSSDVRIETLDWGGDGATLILFAGLGDTAHIFDDFAPKLATSYHVFGLTRRGYGVSTAPASPAQYTSDLIGGDVLATMDALHIQKAVLVGHSYGGFELSYMANHHPGRVQGAVYLDAGYEYALYDREHGSPQVDLAYLTRHLGYLQNGGPGDRLVLLKELVNTDLPMFQQDLRARITTLENQRAHPRNDPDIPAPTSTDRANFPAYQAYLTRTRGVITPEAELRNEYTETPTGGVGARHPDAAIPRAIISDMQKYTSIPVPVLAIFALPHYFGPAIDNDPAMKKLAQAEDIQEFSPQVDAFRKAVPTGRVITLSNADHRVFLSNENEVLREVRNFINRLPNQ